MADKGQAAALTVMTMFEAPNMFSGMLPSLFTISTFSGGDDAKREHTKTWIRKGEVQATLMTMAVAIGAGVISESPWPVIGSLVICGYLVWQYEMAMKQGNSKGPALNIAGGN